MKLALVLAKAALLLTLIAPSLAQAGIIIDPHSASGEWIFEAHNPYVVQSVGGPFFQQLSPAPGVLGLEVLGDATIQFTEDDNLTVGAAFRLWVAASGTGEVTSPVFLTRLNYAYDLSDNFQLPVGTVEAKVFLDLLAPGGEFGAQLVGEGTGLIVGGQGEASFTFAIDTSDFLGWDFFELHAQVDVRTSKFLAGEHLWFSLGGSSLDLGAASAQTIPEPSVAAMFAILIPAAVVRRRQARNARDSAVARDALR